MTSFHWRHRHYVTEMAHKKFPIWAPQSKFLARPVYVLHFGDNLNGKDKAKNIFLTPSGLPNIYIKSIKRRFKLS